MISSGLLAQVPNNVRELCYFRLEWKTLISECLSPPPCHFSLLMTLHTADSHFEQKGITLMTALSSECSCVLLQQPELTFYFIRHKKTENGEASIGVSVELRH